MTEINQELEDFFGFGGTKPESFIVTFSSQKAKAIGLTSESTARKIINSGKFKKSGDDSYGIILERKNGLTVGETVSASSTLSTEMMAVYQELAATLTSLGYSEDEISELIFVPSNHHKLDDECRKIAFTLFKEAQLARNTDITNVTGLLCSRLTPEWEIADTINLPQDIYNQILFFMENEKNSWVEEKNDPKSLGN